MFSFSFVEFDIPKDILGANTNPAPSIVDDLTKSLLDFIS
jgi:hypothetical protein